MSVTQVGDDVIPSRRSRNPAPLVFKGVYVTLAKNDILKNVSGVARSGQILAIMGPSGAGKSTLLNALTGRVPPIKGSITLNGETVSRSLRRKISYVQQHDVFHSNLTLSETLNFAAILRLPDEMPKATKLARISELADGLELTRCIQTEMGRLSGGERKCASIACEMITDPSLLMLDEPTTGLDSAIANSLMTTLTNYAERSAKTVVTTIHQPSSQVFHLFSDLLLLCNGEVAYFGPGSGVTSFFEKIDLYCDPLYNPADFILEMLKSSTETAELIIKTAYTLRESDDWPDELKEKFEAHLPSLQPNGTTAGFDAINKEGPNNDEMHSGSVATSSSTWPSGFRTQYIELTKRSFRRSRHRYLSPSIILQLLFIAVVAGLECFQIANTEKTARDKLGAVYFSCSLFGFFPMYLSGFSVIDDAGVFLRERSAGIYRLSAYYLATVTTETPMLAALVTAYTVITYWMIGMTPAGFNFIVFYLVLMIQAFTSQSIGMLLGIAISNRTVAVTLIQCIFVASLLAAGFYNTHAHKWWFWTRYLSFIGYSYSALAGIEFQIGAKLKCNPPHATIFPIPCAQNGTTYFPGSLLLKSESLEVFPIYAGVLVLIGVTIVCRILAYIVLRYCRRPKT